MFKKLGFLGFTLLVLAGILAGLAEVTVRLVVDDGMQYDLEMWSYARTGKQLSDNPKIGHEHRPNSEFHAMGVDVSINEHGMRGMSVAKEKPPETFRVMMLGDSLTFGWGVASNETFSARLEELLRAKNPNVEVLNTGVGNTNTEMQAEYFASKGREFEPDLVVLNYFINDAEDTPKYADRGFIARHSYAWNYFAARIDYALRLFSRRKGWKEYYADLYGAGGNWAQARAAIKKVADICAVDGCSVFLVNFPELRELKPYPFDDVTAKLRDAATEFGIPFLDLLPAVVEQTPADLWVTRPDPHPNGLANKFFAEAISRRLIDDGVVQ